MAAETATHAENILSHGDSNSPIHEAISLWKTRPHVFNRRLKGAVYSSEISLTGELTWSAFKEGCRQLLSQEEEQFDGVDDATHHGNELLNVQYFVEDSIPNQVEKVLEWIHHQWSLSSVSLCLRKLIPRQPNIYNVLLEVILQFTDDLRDGWLFIPLGEIVNDQLIRESNTETDCSLSSYVLLSNFESEFYQLDLHLYDKFPDNPTERHVLTTNKSWLLGVLINKLNGACKTTLDKNDKSFMPQSLSLVSLERYNDWYVKLKYKYGEELVKKWPERTDPKKYVYEDIAIASYLLVLWEKEREVKGLESKQSFIDMGCGNGLLVYLLVKEGHPGKGIDIRNRKIWDCYDETIILEVFQFELVTDLSRFLKKKQSMVVLTAETSLHPNLFTAPDCDWLIGNHSDELTPWIPFIAARSSYSCRYFVLPCCFHDFNGKFQRSGVKAAQYKTYLSFVEEVGVKCGFNVEKDTLRIPSTKRVCHIGKTRIYDKEEQSTVITKIRSILESRKISLKLFENEIEEAHVEEKDTNFAPRQSYEPIRNCTRIDPSIKISVISTITKMLLNSKEKNPDIGECSTCDDNNRTTTSGVEWKDWNAGGVITIGEVVAQLDPSMLNAMKCQCGGLKTLFRNHSHILKVVKGMVSLRDYREKEVKLQMRGKRKKVSRADDNNKICFKTKLCWFFMSHPDGCPLKSEQCKFAHGDSEIQELPTKEKRQKWDN